MLQKAQVKAGFILYLIELFDDIMDYQKIWQGLKQLNGNDFSEIEAITRNRDNTFEVFRAQYQGRTVYLKRGYRGVQEGALLQTLSERVSVVPVVGWIDAKYFGHITQHVLDNPNVILKPEHDWAKCLDRMIRAFEEQNMSNSPADEFPYNDFPVSVNGILVTVKAKGTDLHHSEWYNSSDRVGEFKKNTGRNLYEAVADEILRYAEALRETGHYDRDISGRNTFLDMDAKYNPTVTQIDLNQVYMHPAAFPWSSDSYLELLSFFPFVVGELESDKLKRKYAGVLNQKLDESKFKPLVEAARSHKLERFAEFLGGIDYSYLFYPVGEREDNTNDFERRMFEINLPAWHRAMVEYGEYMVQK